MVPSPVTGRRLRKLPSRIDFIETRSRFSWAGLSSSTAEPLVAEVLRTGPVVRLLPVLPLGITRLLVGAHPRPAQVCHHVVSPQANSERRNVNPSAARSPHLRGGRKIRRKGACLCPRDAR